MKKNIPVITIDGPSGCGKGTIAERLATELKWHFLDSGVLYRAVGWAVLQQGIAISDHNAIFQLISQLSVEMQAHTLGKSSKIIVNHHDVTDEIRSESCSQMASKISALPFVREALLNKQREMKQKPGLVTDGRDMGTVVFPEAILKFYFEASLEERAKRRYNQLKAKGKHVSLPDVTRELRLRDERDAHRSVSPTKPAADAIMIDTTHMNVSDVFQTVLHYVHEVLK